jgi:hypothetical protein
MTAPDRLADAFEAAGSEEECWVVLLDALEADGRQVEAEVRYSLSGEAAVRVAHRGTPAGPHAVPAGPGPPARCGSARAWVSLIPAPPPGEMEELVVLATATHTALRLQRLREEHATLHRETIRSEVHSLRQDLATLSTLSEAAVAGQLEEPLAPYEQAIVDSARDATRTLDWLAGSAEAARRVQTEQRVPAGPLATMVWRNHHGGRPRPDVELPGGPQPAYRVAEHVAERILSGVLEAAYAAAHDARPAVFVCPHADGWETRVQVRGAAPPRPWRQLPDAGLHEIALAVNLLGGRSWADSDDESFDLCFTLPAAA